MAVEVEVLGEGSVSVSASKGWRGAANRDRARARIGAGDFRWCLAAEQHMPPEKTSFSEASLGWPAGDRGCEA